MKRLLPVLLLLAALAVRAEEEARLPWRATNTAFIAAATERARADAAGKPHRLVRRGLVADRQEGTVRLWAEATGHVDKEIEFFLISEASGHDYEALAVAFCTPGDVRDALLFLGLPPGRPVDFGAFRFWPKGERVLTTFRWTPPSVAGEPVAPVEAAAERLVYDKAAKAPLPAAGLVFTASRPVQHLVETNRTALAADLFDPHSIASDYNDPDTILDVPRQAPKNVVYGWQIPNPEYRFTPGQLVEVVMRPERTDGSRRVLDLELTAAPDGTNAAPVFTLKGLPEGALTTPFPQKLADTLQAVTNRHQDPCVLFRPDRALPLEKVRLACALLEILEQQGAARVEPPAPGEPYYRAFLPQEKFRTRDAWVVKPLELHLFADGAGATGTVTIVSESWKDLNAEPELTFTTRAVASPGALREILGSIKRETPVMVVHAPAGLPYGVLADYAAAVMPTHPTMWFFLKPE